MQPARSLLGGIPDPIAGFSVETAQTLDSILAAGAWEDVVVRVRELAVGGALTPELLAANEALLERAKRDKALPDLIQSLTSVRDLLRDTLAAVERMRPKSELVEALTALDPSVTAERALIDQLMADAFSEGGAVDRLEFVEDIVAFCNDRDEDDARFLAAVVEGRLDLGTHALEDVMTVRRAGRSRMKALVDIASCFAA